MCYLCIVLTQQNMLFCVINSRATVYLVVLFIVPLIQDYKNTYMYESEAIRFIGYDMTSYIGYWLVSGSGQL